MATELIAFAPGVQSEVPFAPMSAIKRAVRDAIIQFCEETFIWKVDLTAMDVEEDVSRYEMLPNDHEEDPVQTDVIGPVEVYIDGVRIDPLTEDWVKQADASWKSKEAQRSTNYFVEYPDILVLYPIPTEEITDGLLVRAALRPSQTATEVEDFFFNRYRRAIEYGAKALLLGQKSRDWYDSAGTEKNEKLFRQAIGSARGEVSRNFTTAPRRVRMRSW